MIFFFRGQGMDCNYLQNLVHHFREGVSKRTSIFCNVFNHQLCNVRTQINIDRVTLFWLLY